MKREETKYCEECKYCRSIREVYPSDFYIDCDKNYYRFQQPVVYCRYKKLLKREKKENVK